ncbi:hypothetical protein ACFW93_09840 [Streptomyces canus]|uniref:hypothetical protein n=1 Tax=Streptomyces canus TaxID=58343 RepID=UPI0036BDA34D
MSRDRPRWLRFWLHSPPSSTVRPLPQPRDRLLELVDRLQEEHGPVTEDEHAAALAEREDLDAEHRQRPLRVSLGLGLLEARRRRAPAEGSGRRLNHDPEELLSARWSWTLGDQCTDSPPSTKID